MIRRKLMGGLLAYTLAQTLCLLHKRHKSRSQPRSIRQAFMLCRMMFSHKIKDEG